MNKIYCETFALRTSDFDCYGQIKPSSVLDLFQEVAGAHANELGIGFEALFKKNLLWVLVKVKFEIEKEIKEHQRVVVKTWPLPAGRVTLQREYLIEDLNGSLLVRGSSEWVTIDSIKRRIVTPSNVYPLEEYCEEHMFQGKFVKVSDFTVENSACEIIPAFCDLDRNGHVNNIRYADYVLNALEMQKHAIRNFQIDFHREIQKGNRVSLFLLQNEEVVLAKGIGESGEKMFSCAIGLN